MDNHWQIEHNCPQCGAPVTLDETDRIFACPFCRTRLYLTVKDFFRYHIPPAEILDGDLLYLPYWRLRGSLFSVAGIDVLHRFVDTNAVAVSHPGLPYSLGLRPQVLKIRFVMPSTPGRFIEPKLSAEQAFRAVLPFDGAFYQNFIGEAVSLIYAPLYLRGNMLVDAVLGRPVAPCSADERERLLTPPLPA
jgi:DNA-directed RNA polymerase subunit RPC12/RpoP